ncbi:MAG: hypothetical protein H6575_05145 [Lewinellaceae bacterium]|nr:hypothetical protein [Lewinellaceae bacterium]
MHYIAERNERRSRRQALVLAIALHLGLAAALYLYSTDQPKEDIGGPTLVKTEKRPLPPKARAVNTP